MQQLSPLGTILSPLRWFTGEELLIEDPPIKGTTTYDDWVTSDFNVMTWLINNKNEKVSAGFMFLKSVKECTLMSRISLELLNCLRLFSL